MPRKKRSTLDPEYVAAVLEVPDELAETEGTGGKRKKRKKSLPEDYLASFSDEPRKRRRRKRKRRRSQGGDDYLSVITEPPEREREKPRRRKANTTTIPSDYLERIMDPPPDEEEVLPEVSLEEGREGDDASHPSNVESAEESEGTPAPSASEERKDRAPLPRGPDGRFLPRSASETRSGERKKRGKGRPAPSPSSLRHDERDERDTGPDEPGVSAKDAGSSSEPEPSPKAPFDPSTITFIALQPFHLPEELYERAQNVVRHLRGKPHELTFARLIENALRAEIERLENGHDDGEPFPGHEDATRGRGKRSRGARTSKGAPAAKKARKKTGGKKG